MIYTCLSWVPAIHFRGCTPMNHKENPQTSTHKPIPCASLHSLHPGFGKQHLKGQGVIGWIPVAILVPILDPWGERYLDLQFDVQ